ncbi:CdiA family toxin C-terminal domain-containing protein [Xenorhabdus mauleonii]|nr:CdiA family toxin C-terminal domain-containing protein [Xenorhabdus mauleonii]
MIAVCASNPAACKEKYGDIPANGLLVRQAIDRVLGADVPSQMKNDMSSLLAQQIEAEGIVSSTEFAHQLISRYGIDKQQAEILAGAALGAVTGGMGSSKGNKPSSSNAVKENKGANSSTGQQVNAGNSGVKTPQNQTGKTAERVIPENFTAEVSKHNTQVGLLNKKKTSISGAHKQDTFLESVEILGAKVTNKITDKKYPGLIEYSYQLPSVDRTGKPIGYKKTQSKTTYDPRLLSDDKVLNMSTQAAKQSKDYFISNPDKREYSTKVDGYWFRVTKDAKSGEISNAFITMPSRNIP